jgi:hypothetical protein
MYRIFFERATQKQPISIDRSLLMYRGATALGQNISTDQTLIASTYGTTEAALSTNPILPMRRYSQPIVLHKTCSVDNT